jgi:hypothetical protein
VAETDVAVRKQGAFFVFYVISNAASEWVEENMADNRTLSHHALIVEDRKLFDVAAAMCNAGLKVKFEPNRPS